MGRKVQAAFFDIDGTLIDHEHGSVVPESTLQSLSLLRRRGVKLFIATGRTPDMLWPVKRIFPFDGFVTMNGQMVLDREGNVLRREAIRDEAILALMETLKKDPIPCALVEEDASFPSRDCPRLRGHFNWMGVPFPPLYDPKRLREHPILQFMAFIYWEDRHRLDGVPYIEVTSAGGDDLDVIPQGGGKDVGIAAAAEHYGFRREDIMVFGDGKNDVRMISWAGMGVALGSGDQAAKDAADFVTTPVGEDGIKNALLHYGVLTESDFT